MWCLWHQYYMILTASTITHDTDASMGTSTDTNTMPLYNHVNMTNAMVPLMVSSASWGRKHVIAMYMSKSICISHMYKFIHVHISDNNVTRNTAIHASHITGRCPWINMLHTSHIYVPIYYYCGLHTDPTLLHIQVQ